MNTDSNRIIPKKKPNLWHLVNWAFLLLIVAIIINDSEIFINWIILITFFLYGIFFLDINIRETQWEILAKRIKLKIRNSTNISGTYKGFTVLIDTFTRGIYRFRRQYTQFEVTFPKEISTTFTIEMKKFWNMERGVGTNDPVFDKLYRLKTIDPDFVKKLLRNYRILQGFLDLGKSAKEMKLSVTSKSIVYVERYITKDINYLQALLDWLILISNELIRQEQFDF
jgi:hypothetical protein